MQRTLVRVFVPSCQCLCANIHKPWTWKSTEVNGTTLWLGRATRDSFMKTILFSSWGYKRLDRFLKSSALLPDLVIRIITKKWLLIAAKLLLLMQHWHWTWEIQSVSQRVSRGINMCHDCDHEGDFQDTFRATSSSSSLLQFVVAVLRWKSPDCGLFYLGHIEISGVVSFHLLLLQ